MYISEHESFPGCLLKLNTYGIANYQGESRCSRVRGVLRDMGDRLLQMLVVCLFLLKQNYGASSRAYLHETAKLKNVDKESDCIMAMKMVADDL